MDNKLRKTVLFTALICVTNFLYSLFGIDTILANKTYDYHKKWMDNLKDETQIYNLSIPGTHNSGALYSYIDLSGKCQDLSIKSQLNIGVRFLDIRLKNTKYGLQVVHSFVDQKQSFESVLQTCNSFLDENPSEFIFLSVKEDDVSTSDRPFSNTVNNLLERHVIQNKFHMSNLLPRNVAEARGKIIFMSRFEGSAYGLRCRDGWIDTENNSTTNTFDLIYARFHVQDYYDIEKYDYKIAEINRCLENKQEGRLNLNFASGYYSNSFPPLSASPVAKDVNKYLLREDVLVKNKDFGILACDFITEDLTDKIIKANTNVKQDF